MVGGSYFTNKPSQPVFLATCSAVKWGVRTLAWFTCSQSNDKLSAYPSAEVQVDVISCISHLLIPCHRALFNYYGHAELKHGLSKHLVYRHVNDACTASTVISIYNSSNTSTLCQL